MQLVKVKSSYGVLGLGFQVSVQYLIEVSVPISMHPKSKATAVTNPDTIWLSLRFCRTHQQPTKHSEPQRNHGQLRRNVCITLTSLLLIHAVWLLAVMVLEIGAALT